MMAESVFFSVLIPVYNAAPWLSDCLDSVLGQGYENLELVLVDDGSTDDSGVFCNEYAARDRRVRVIHQENSGSMAARHRAIEEAKGDYYLFVDADDQLLPGALPKLAAAIRESGADCLLYGFRMETPGETWHIANPAKLCSRLITDKREVLRLVIGDDSYNSLCRKCARASCFDGRDLSPWYHISRGEDMIQSTEILENAESFYFLPQELYLYRFNRASVTHSISYDGFHADFAYERYLYDWLRRLALFEEADYDRFRNYILDKLVINLKRICRWCSDREHTVAALESILNAEFYRDFLSAGYRGGGGGARRLPNRLAIRLLNRRRFDALIFFCARVYRAG